MYAMRKIRRRAYGLRAASAAQADTDGQAQLNTGDCRWTM
jgi:hypothetical protein